MAAASAVRHVGLIDPESCLTNVCTCVDVWTCEHDSSIFYSRTYLLSFYFHHTCTNAMDILHDCLQKVSLNKYVTSAQMLIEPAMWNFIFFWTWILRPFRRFPIVQHGAWCRRCQSLSRCKRGLGEDAICCWSRAMARSCSFILCSCSNSFCCQSDFTRDFSDTACDSAMRKKMLPSCPWYSCTSSTPWRGRTPHLIVARSNVHTFTRSHVHTFTRSHVHTFTEVPLTELPRGNL